MIQDAPMSAEQQAAAVRLMPMIPRVVRWFRGADCDELESEGYLALCRSVGRYSPRYGVSLRTYVWRHVWKSLCVYCARSALPSYRTTRGARTNMVFDDNVVNPDGPTFPDCDSPEERQILTLYLDHRHSLKDIGRIVGKDWRTVRRVLHRICKRVCNADA